MYQIFLGQDGKPRQAVPVRQIPFATGWFLDPTAIARLCSGTEPRVPGGSELIFLSSYYIVPTGETLQVPARDWDETLRDLSALGQRLKAQESTKDENIQEWRTQSINLLPNTTFVWHDDLINVWEKLYPRMPDTAGAKFDADKEYPAYENRPGDYDLNLQSYVPNNIKNSVFEGFEDLIAPTGTDAVPFLVARRVLSERWSADEEEIAIWIWRGDLKAYWHDSNLNGPLVPFSFLSNSQDDVGYRKLLSGLFFSKQDIDEFEPESRYMTGAQVIDRWAQWGDKQMVTEMLRTHSDADTEDLSMAPIPLYPLASKDRPIDVCLFRVDQIQVIEQKLFSAEETQARNNGDTKTEIIGSTSQSEQPEQPEQPEPESGFNSHECFPYAPQSKDDWFNAINEVTEELFQIHMQCPNRSEVWYQLKNEYSEKYKIVPHRVKKDVILMGGEIEDALSKRAFDRRWRRWTTGKA